MMDIAVRKKTVIVMVFFHHVVFPAFRIFRFQILSNFVNF